MSRPRRASPRKPIQEALQAGALVGGVFLSLLGLLRAALRLGVLPRGEVVVLLPLAIAVVMLPLGAGLKFGFRDDTPPSLRAYRHALPWSRSPTEELLGAVLGGALWSVVGMALAALAERLLPSPGSGAIALAVIGPALAAWALWAIHGRRWPTPRVIAVIILADTLLATPQLLLGPRGPLGGAAGLGVLAREYFEAASRHGQSPALLAHAHALAARGCAEGDARSCLLAAFHAPPPAPPSPVPGASAPAAGSAAAPSLVPDSDDFYRRGCDLATADLALCARFVGEGFTAVPGGPSGCSPEARCAGGYGVDCRAGLLACKRALAPRALQPACARREAGGWREVWCAQPRD